MFIFNLKINGSKTFKYFFIGVILFLIFILIFVTYKIFSGANNNSKENCCLPQNNVSQISPSNYTNILKAVHENIDSYIGKKISFTGYVYRVSDLTENQFVLARDMIISSDYQTVIVGFLCEYENASNLVDNSWVTITGEITKGIYHGDMPIIKILNIEITDKPSSDELVYPPDDSYIPTAGII